MPDSSSSKKRKAPSASAPTAAPSADPRFAFSEADLADDDHPQPEASTSAAASEPSKPGAGLPAHLLPASMSGKGKPTPGLIYLSRIPPGMGPAQVKHLLGAYGEVGRVFLKRADADAPAAAATSSKKRFKVQEKHKEHKFAEGWIEFLDKRVARSVAEMLNAVPIGGKKGSRWHDDIWTMRYLPRFRWDMLSEQVALERATQTSLLRFHLEHSRREQESYLEAVETARVHSAMDAKADAKRAEKRAKLPGGAADGTGAGDGAAAGKKKRERTFRQREQVQPGAKKPEGSALSGVLSSLF